MRHFCCFQRQRKEERRRSSLGAEIPSIYPTSANNPMNTKFTSEWSSSKESQIATIYQPHKSTEPTSPRSKQGYLYFQEKLNWTNNYFVLEDGNRSFDIVTWYFELTNPRVHWYHVGKLRQFEKSSKKNLKADINLISCSNISIEEDIGNETCLSVLFFKKGEYVV